MHPIPMQAHTEKARTFLTENPGHQTTNRNKLPGNLINQLKIIL